MGLRRYAPWLMVPVVCISTWMASLPLRAGAPEDTAVPVRVATAAPLRSAGDIRSTGTLVFKHEVTMGFKVAGFIAGFSVDVGDVVKKGQVLARLDPTEVRSRNADAEAQLGNAKQALKRSKELFDKGFVSQARLDDAQMAVQRATAGRAATQFEEAKARLVAPVDGVVLSKLVDVDEVVSPGAPILVIGETKSGLVLKAPISDTQITRLRVGDKALVVFSGLPGVQASVSRLAAQADQRTGSFDVELRLADVPDGLRSGLVGAARIQPSVSNAAASAVAIPALALLEGRGDQAAVFVIDGGNKARRASVRVAGFLDDVVLIASGLVNGDQVVTSGAPYLRNGQKVLIVKDQVSP